MCFDARAELRQGEDFVVREDPTAPFRGRERDAPVAVGGITEDRVRLCADPNVEQARPLLGHDVCIRFDLAADDHLAEAERTLDDDATLVGGRRIDGEHDATTFGRNHGLHDHGDRWLVGDPTRAPIGNDARTEERGPTVDNAREELVGAYDVRERLVHSRERRGRGVLARCGGTYGDAAASELLVCLEDGRAQLGRDTGLANEVLQAVAGRGQRGGVVGVDPGGQLGELRAHAGAIHRLEKGGGGHDEPRWNRKTGVRQLAEVGALPACARDVGRREILEPDDVTHCSRMRHLGGPVQGRTAFPVASLFRAHRR